MDAASAVAPYYYHYGEADVIAYYQDVLDAIGSTIPFYIYSNPKFSGYPVELKTLRRLQGRIVRHYRVCEHDPRI